MLSLFDSVLSPAAPIRNVPYTATSSGGPVEEDSDEYKGTSTSRGFSASEEADAEASGRGGGDGTIGTNPNQEAALRRDIQQAEQEGATDIRANQEQTNAQGVRVGRNRPDLQYTDQNGIRHYIEYDQDPSNGAAHAQRIQANDPAGIVTPKTVK